MNNENKTTSSTPVLDALMDEISPLDSRKTEDRMVIAARIGDLIKEKGWSKTFFASQVDQLPSVISKWLSGTHNFTLDTLTEISYVLDIPLSELLREKAQALVFRSNFAVTGIGGLIDRRAYGGPMQTHPDFDHLTGTKLTQPTAEPMDWDYLTKMSPTIGIMTVPHHGSQDWHAVGSTYWMGNVNVLHPKKKKGDDQERNYALKA